MIKQVKQYEYVDLGLPSGLKWAKCNVGAETETDYGDYFMWGSTTPNTNTTCNWANAPFNNGSSDYDEEYFTTHKSEWLDDKDNLKPEFDAAYKATDGAARMPTQDECKELIDNTNSVWVPNYNNSGINGRKFTSKKNGNSIFIPAAGTYFEGSEYDLNKFVDVWSSSLYTSLSDVAYTMFFSSDSLYVADDSGFRNAGCVVRGVCE